MPFATARPTFGTILKVGDGQSPQAFIEIEQIQDIQGPKATISRIDKTVHNQGVPVRSYQPSLFDPGTMTFKIVQNSSLVTHLSTSTVSLEYIKINRQIRDFQIVNVDPSGTTRQFQAYVQDIGEAYPLDGIDVRDVTLQLCSLPSPV